MPNKIYYKKGDRVKNLIFIKELTDKSIDNEQFRIFQLKCPKCGAEITCKLKVVRNGKKCKCSYGPRYKKHGDASKTGKYNKLYTVWQAMVQRTCNPNSKVYESYGGRGVIICNEWLDYSTFKEWAISNGYKEGLTIDRKENDFGYYPENCRWVTRHVQVANRRKAKNKTSKYIGVCFKKQNPNMKWFAFIKINRKTTGIGSFATELEAARARDKYVIDNNLNEYKLNFNYKELWKKD